MKKIIRKSVSTVCYALGSVKALKGIMVLMYHRINDALKPDDLVISTKTFRQQMEYLYKNKYKVIGLQEMLRYLSGSPKSPKTPESPEKTVVITFDDGYRDNYLNAYPVLEELNFPAVIFLIAGMIGTNQKRPRYQHLPDPDMLLWSEAQEMAHHGIEFGAHTFNHPRLSKIDLAQAKKEIEESYRKVNHLMKGGVRSFCYPYGNYNAAVKKLVQDAGFDCAFTVKPGRNEAGCDLFELKRTGTNGNDSIFDFKKKLAGAYDVLHKLAQKKEGM